MKKGEKKTGIRAIKHMCPFWHLFHKEKKGVMRRLQCYVGGRKEGLRKGDQKKSCHSPFCRPSLKRGGGLWRHAHCRVRSFHGWKKRGRGKGCGERLGVPREVISFWGPNPITLLGSLKRKEKGRSEKVKIQLCRGWNLPYPKKRETGPRSSDQNALS